MNRYFRLFALFFLLVFLLPACRQQPSVDTDRETLTIDLGEDYHEVSVPDSNPSVYATYTVDIANDGFPGAPEKDWRTDSWKDPSADRTCCVTINGQIYEGDYGETIKNRCCDYSYHCYDIEDIRFYLDARDGSFVGYNLGLNRRVEEHESCPDSTDPLEAAKQTVSEYVSVDDYTIEYTTNEWKGITFYYYVFAKYLGDLRTSDNIFVTVSSKGVICALRMQNIGRFDDLQPSVVDREELKKSIEYKLDYWYAEHFNYTYSVYEQLLGFSTDGDLIVETQIRARVIAINPNQKNICVILNGVGYETLMVLDTVIRE